MISMNKESLEGQQENKHFTIDNTLTCKGVAICIMLFHHLFYPQQLWENYWWKLRLGNRPLIAFIAMHGKICVTIFVLLSAYGLTFSYRKLRDKEKSIKEKWKTDIHFSKIQIKKLYLLYWPIFIAAVICGGVTGLRIPSVVYNSLGEGIRDFLGIAYIIDGETPFNDIWWYISFALVLYMLFPLLYKIVRKFPYVMLAISFVIGIKPLSSIPIMIEFRRYSFVVCMGVFLAESDLVSKMLNAGTKLFRIVLAGSACIVFFFIRCVCPFTFDVFLAIAIIVLVVEFTGDKGRSSLKFLGKHSGNIFLIHGLLYQFFLKKMIYGFWYPPLIWGVLLGISLVCSIVTENIKKYLKLQNCFFISPKV